MRIISDELYARIVLELSRNESVSVFQQLLLSPKQDEKTEDAAAEIEEKSE